MRISPVSNYAFRSLSPFENAGFSLPKSFAPTNLITSAPTPLQNPAPALVKPKSKAPLIITGIAIAAAATVGIVALARNKRPDYEYIQTLAKDMGAAFGIKVKPRQLKSVVGPDELKSILKNLNFENYDSANMANGLFRANLHTHTYFSDGNASVAQMLDSAVKYADELHAKTKEKFLFAITDHDSLKAPKEALRLIAQDPKKYQNLRFVAGIEKSFSQPCPPGMDQQPTKIFEFLAYAINPFCPTLNKSIDNLQNARKSVAHLMIDEINNAIPDTNLQLKDFFGIKNVPDKDFIMNINWNVYTSAKKMLPAHEGTINGIADKFKVRLKDDKLVFPSGHRFEHSLEEAVEPFKKSGFGFLSLAHPGYIAIPHKYSAKEPFFDYMQDLISRFKKCAPEICIGAETNYQWYKEGYLQPHIPKITEILKKNNLLPTGGIDNHEFDAIMRYNL